MDRNLTETAARASYSRHRATAFFDFAEVGWLVYFFAIFVAFVYAFNLWVVPHHFNDKIASTLAAWPIAMIATPAG